MNAERVLVASESLGDGRWFTEKAVAYANEREVFGAPIGANQGVQFPIARHYASLKAAELMVRQAAALFDAGQPCGAEANMAKMLSSEAAWELAVCFRQGIRYRAQVARGEAIQDRTNFYQLNSGLRGPACPGVATVILSNQHIEYLIQIPRHFVRRSPENNGFSRRQVSAK